MKRYRLLAILFLLYVLGLWASYAGGLISCNALLVLACVGGVVALVLVITDNIGPDSDSLYDSVNW